MPRLLIGENRLQYEVKILTMGCLAFLIATFGSFHLDQVWEALLFPCNSRLTEMGGDKIFFLKRVLVNCSSTKI